MVWKHKVGDFDLKVIPCKYWFVRYAVFCMKKFTVDDEGDKVHEDCDCVEDQSKCSMYIPDKFSAHQDLDNLPKGHEV